MLESGADSDCYTSVYIKANKIQDLFFQTIRLYMQSKSITSQQHVPFNLLLWQRFSNQQMTFSFETSIKLFACTQA